MKRERKLWRQSSTASDRQVYGEAERWRETEMQERQAE